MSFYIRAGFLMLSSLELVPSPCFFENHHQNYLHEIFYRLCQLLARVLKLLQKIILNFISNKSRTSLDLLSGNTKYQIRRERKKLLK